jgi:capsular exopolysaccharide synthesis family protein
MSRIEEALRRAQERPDGERRKPGPAKADGAPHNAADDAAAESPWSFDGDGGGPSAPVNRATPRVTPAAPVAPPAAPTRPPLADAKLAGASQVSRDQVSPAPVSDALVSDDTLTDVSVPADAAPRRAERVTPPPPTQAPTQAQGPTASSLDDRPVDDNTGVERSPVNTVPFGKNVLPDPRDKEMAVFHGFDLSVEERTVVSKEAPAISVEQYRRLAATLHHAQGDRGIQIVMITSAVAGEGKSLTATNLALTLSQSYRRRVLLVDADLRRPSMHKIFQIRSTSGLTDGLRAEGDRALSVLEVSEHLSILPAGAPDPDPMSSLTSARMRQILQEAASKFDWVIIDTPPVALLPDANLLAAMTDVTILVVRANETPFELVQRAIDSVGKDRIMGVVLNRAEDSRLPVGHDYEAYYEAYSRPR